MLNQIRIVVADDHDFFRDTLVRYLKNIQGVEVVGEAKNGMGALEITYNSFPRLVIMDVMMPVMDGIEACSIIKDQAPDIKVVLFSMHNMEALVIDGKAPADKYIAKDRLFNELPSIIEEFGRT